jgi:translation initiation factor IF-1
MTAQGKETSGIILEVLPRDMFRVELEGGRKVVCQLTGQARMRLTRLLAGDSVRVKVSPYDPNRGSIIERL